MIVDFSRRNFLKGSFAFGGLMATGALPALADDPLLFPQRGRWERLSIVSHHIKAGASKPFAILHISDTHLTAAHPDESEAIRNRAKTRSITFGGRQEEALRDSLAWAKEHVDYVVHTGDLIDFQTKANFDLICKLCGDAFPMMTCAPGNHEFYHEWKKEVRENETQDFYAYLASQPLLKAILAGHNHVTAADRFSPTAMEYVVGGNFLFHGAEITIE